MLVVRTLDIAVPILHTHDMTTALLVIDVQNHVVENAADRDGVIRRINALIAKARQAQVPLIFVQHNDDFLVRGSDDWKLVPELDYRTSDRLVEKIYRDAFAETTLLHELSLDGVTTVIVTGAQSDYCVTTVSHSALVHGFDVTLVRDAHTTGDAPLPSSVMPGSQIVEYVNDHFASLSYPGRVVRTMDSAEIDFAR